MAELNELEKLKEENELLKKKNDKLYKDCVSFAKKIKAFESVEIELNELKEENEELKSEIARLSSTERPEEYSEPEYSYEPDYEVPEVEAPSFSAAYIPEEHQQLVNDAPVYDPVDITDSIPTNHSTHKFSPFLAFIRTILWIIFVLSMIVGLISAVAFIFSTNYKDYTVAGYRFAKVQTTTMSPDIDTDSVMLIKYQGFDDIPLDSLVVTTKNSRSIAKLKGIDLINGEHVATVEDRYETYTVTEKQFIGRVMFTIPYIGVIVEYACAYQYNYLAICVSAILVSLALLLLIPSNKSRNPKFGKDYGVEEFTI